MTKLTFTETQELINKYDIGYIYIVRVDEYIKIGISNMPEQRITLIRSDNPKRLEEILVIKIPLKYDTEQLIHSLLKKAGWHVRGEWFEYRKGWLDEVIDILFMHLSKNKKHIRAEGLNSQFTDSLRQLREYLKQK